MYDVRCGCLTYKYSLIAVILVPIICTLSMSLLVSLASQQSLQQSITRFRFSHDVLRRRVFGEFRRERLRDYLNENCHRCGSATGWATEETWTESTVFVVFIFILFLEHKAFPRCKNVPGTKQCTHTQLYPTFFTYIYI